MLRRLARGAPLAALLVLSVRAGAEPVAAPKPVATPELRRDAQGIRGISPFTEALKRGDRALLAGDLQAAIVAYRDALSKEAQNPLGYYRLGEVQIMKGDLQAAEQAFTSGLRFVNAAGLGLKAKLQFALADLRERQKAYDEAIVQWTEYEALTIGQPPAPGFPACASERKRALAAWQKLSADSLEVKARIEKGLQAADEAVRKSSK